MSVQSEGPRFSRRTSWNTEESELARALAARRASGLPLYDLTASNPTRCGFNYDPALMDALKDVRAFVYDPDARGLRTGREAVARYYAGCGAVVEPDQLVLTTSTSEGYSFLFRLLCDAGDEVLIAEPSYPLFDFLAVLDDVRLVPFPLVYDHGWQIDAAALAARITSRTRAIAVVHPNNPTGQYVSAGERAMLEALCVRHHLALIVDEVFLDYPLESEPVASFAASQPQVLTFVLSGISKVAGLPQMKAAWIACCGPDPTLRPALERLHVIADTFLSMNAPVQLALPAWLAGAGAMQRQIGERVRLNLVTLDTLLAVTPLVTRLRADAGWYATLRVPALAAAETLAVRLLVERGVAVHPGYFFGMRGDGWLVVSLLTAADEFAAGAARLTGFFE